MRPDGPLRPDSGQGAATARLAPAMAMLAACMLLYGLLIAGVIGDTTFLVVVVLAMSIPTIAMGWIAGAVIDVLRGAGGRRGPKGVDVRALWPVNENEPPDRLDGRPRR
jgi:hypothetical protein